MKTIFLLCAGSVFALTGPNAVNVTTYIDPGVVAKVNHTYTDGLGKKLQTHEEITTNDIVIGYVYDKYGRLVKTTKPFVNAGHDYLSTSDPTVQANAYYDGSSSARPNAGGKAYSEDVLADAPPSRVKQHGEAGGAFSVAGHPVKTWYIGLSSQDPIPPPLSDVDLDNRALLPLTGRKYHLKVVKDANGHYSQEISDLFGNVLKTWADPSSAAGDEIVSASMYDYVGHAMYSWPPGPGGEVDASRMTVRTFYSTGEIADITTPDKGFVSYIYDRDAKLRFYMTERDINEHPGQRAFHLIRYDRLGREIARGVFSTTQVDPEIYDQLHANNMLFPLLSTTASLDDYPTDAQADHNGFFDFTSRKTYDDTHELTNLNLNRPDIYGALKNLKGHLVAEISFSNSSGYRIYNFFSYDADARVATEFKCIPGMAVHAVDYTYDLQGNVKTKTLRDVDHAKTLGVWTYVYTNGRLSSIQKDGVTSVSYNQLATGELSQRHYMRSGTIIGHEFLTYNIRNWPLQIKGTNAAGTTLFSEDINYEAGTTTPAQYNGTIAKAKYVYQSPAITQTLDYTYDQTDRLLGTSTGSTSYDEHFTYDASSRIVSKKETTSQPNVTYDYVPGTNQLKSIIGNAKKGNANGNYVYDTNGNMVFDRSKMMSVEYNDRDLPERFRFWSAMPDRVLTWQDFYFTIPGTFSGMQVLIGYDAEGKRVLKEELQ